MESTVTTSYNQVLNIYTFAVTITAREFAVYVFYYTWQDISSDFYPVCDRLQLLLMWQSDRFKYQRQVT